MIPVGSIVEVGLRLVETLGRIKTRDPKTRAASMRARAVNLRAAAAMARTEAQRHEINATNNPDPKSIRFHRRMMKRFDVRAMKLQARALWWDNRAARIDP